MLHEAFCLYSQRDIFEPYKKNHSTVKDACELAEKLGVPNLVLYHTEDKNIENRKALYTEEGKMRITTAISLCRMIWRHWSCNGEKRRQRAGTFCRFLPRMGGKLCKAALHRTAVFNDTFTL